MDVDKVKEPLKLAWKTHKWSLVHIVKNPPVIPDSWMTGDEPTEIRGSLKMLCGSVFPGTDKAENYEVGDFDGLNEDCGICCKIAGVSPREYTG